MREMAFLPQEYMIFQPHHHPHIHHHQQQHNHNRNHHDFDHHDDHHNHDPSISLNILSSCRPQQDFPGGQAGGMGTLTMMNRSMSFPAYGEEETHDHDHEHEHEHEPDQTHHHHGAGGGGDGDELSDDGSQVFVGGGGGEKKKRLNMEQVKTLEKNFELGNKLEPERKVQLAKALGLQPRQVAIWFQNRRARWKTKQLEKDYGVLKRQFDSLKADNDSLLSLNNKLHAELISLRNREAGAKYNGGNNNKNSNNNNNNNNNNNRINLNNADTKSYWSNNGSDISSDINLGTSTRNTPQCHHAGSPLSNFPSNSFTITQFLINQNTDNTDNNKTELDLIRCPKLDQEDAFCNAFGAGAGAGAGAGGVDQNQTTTSFWAWPEQQHLN